jgi:hypothetical protein
LIALFDYHGAFVNWMPLDSHFKFKWIIDANSLTIRAQTKDNRFYSFRLDNFCITQAECNQWIEIEEVSNLNYADDPLIERGVSCSEFTLPLFFREPSGNIVECIHAEEFIIPEMRSIAYYVLLDDGRVLVWDFTDSFIRSRGVIASGLLILIVGSLSGTIAFIFFKNRRSQVPYNRISKRIKL